MTVERHTSAKEFLDVVGAELRRTPVINQLPLGIAAKCAADPAHYGPDVRFYSAREDGAITGAAVQTAPQPVQLALGTIEAARALGEVFARDHAPLTAVAGPDVVAEAFAQRYAAEHGLRYQAETALGVFALESVAELPVPPGQRAVATSDHAPLLQRWLAEFHVEAVPHDPPVRPGAGEAAAAAGRAHLWIDAAGTPVALAFTNREIERWTSVGPVYTPLDLRGRGYATALVAALSRHLLATGRLGCMLFTNLANPTSNAIYQRIGYRRVGTATRYAFR